MNHSLLATTSLQQNASNPSTSCWVNASAGSGKTKVLIDRIIRLLLMGTKSERIICLTFSRAAAYEMQQRLMLRLQSMAKMPDSELVDQLSHLGEETGVTKLSQARALYSLIQTQPVTIQTVHSFCQSLLQRHMEKNIAHTAPRVMENFEEHTYLDKAFAALVVDQNAIAALEEFLTFHNDNVLLQYLRRTTQNPNNLNFEAVKARLNELFDITCVPKFPILILEIQKLIKGLLNIDLPSGDIAQDHPFIQNFLTQKGTVRAKILPASIQKQYLSAEEKLKIYAEQLAHYYLQKNRFDQVQKSLQFWQLQQIFKMHYKRLKEVNHLWDFNDLIEKTLQILDLDSFDQILFDLNYRIDHILVDEAQDTSVSQWHVIEQLVRGLFADSTNIRSLFVVGDEKQSIYSFQGADIHSYQEMQKHLASLCLNWEKVNLTTSFRSGKTLLKLVDTVFKQNADGLGENVADHVAHHLFNGSVEVLEFIEPEANNIDPWPIFETYSAVPEPEQLLAEQVLDHLEQSLAKGLWLESENRHATWCDVMILMRKRGKIMQQLATTCELRQIPYSAFDPKNLMECLVVQDLLSAVEFMAMPLNDLNLAGLLKSPWLQQIRKIDEDALFNLCHSRPGFLWTEVQSNLPQHAAILEQLLQVQPANAYDYFYLAYKAMQVECELLHSFLDDVFKRFNLLDLSLRELINHLHDFPPILTQTTHQEGLQLSTVHGAKGLESPIVVIIDNGDEPNLKQDIVLYDPVTQLWFLKPPMAADTILTTAIKDHQQRALEFERNRLFYVALTRVKERLILAGLPHEPSANSWYWRVSQALLKPN